MRVTKRSIVGAAAIAAATLLAGCTSQTDLQQLNQNEFTLRGMIASDRQQIDSLQQQLRRLNDEITVLKHGAAGAGGDASSMGDRVASLESEVKSLQAGMAAAPGAIPPTAAGDSTGAAAPAAPGTASAAAPAVPVAAAEVPPTWPAELDEEITAAKSSSEAGVKLYREGLEAMKAAKYPLAVSKFTKLQHAYPKSELSEPAEYFTANALYETGGYDQAILQFNDLVMRYPKGKFAATAQLREAQAFIRINDPIDAKLTLKKLVADHAGTPQASAASAMMNSLASN